MTQDSKPGGFARGFRENTEAIVVAFTFALIIRCFFLEVFQIPTTSMEPTLLGDITSGQHHNSRCPFVDYHGREDQDQVQASGDRIMVTKFYYGTTDVRRFDVVVFKYPLNIARNFIKRVVGLPDEEFMVYEGNIYTRPGKGRDSESFRIARKDATAQSRIWIRADPVDGYLDSLEEFKKYWPSYESANAQKDPIATFEIRGGELATYEHRGSKFSLFRHGVVRDYEGGSSVDDLRVKLDLELQDLQGSFFLQIDNRYGTFEFVIGGKAGSQFTFQDGAGDKRTQRLDVRPEAGTHTLELEVYDGRFFVRYDGKSLVNERNEFMTTLDDARRNPRDKNEVAFGSKDSTFTVRRLALWRDVHHKCRGTGLDRNLEEERPVYIEPRHYVMMGDNTESSHDSRAWTRYTVKLKNGREVVFERKAIEDGVSAAEEPAFKSLVDSSKGPLKYFVKEDRFGNAVPVYESEFDKEEIAGFFMVGQQYIVGRALWIWAPPRRWKLIR